MALEEIQPAHSCSVCFRVPHPVDQRLRLYRVRRVVDIFVSIRSFSVARGTSSRWRAGTRRRCLEHFRCGRCRRFALAAFVVLVALVGIVVSLRALSLGGLANAAVVVELRVRQHEVDNPTKRHSRKPENGSENTTEANLQHEKRRQEFLKNKQTTNKQASISIIHNETTRNKKKPSNGRVALVVARQ